MHGLSNVASLYWFSPESVLTVGILVILTWDLVTRGASRKMAGTLTLLTLAASLVATLASRDGQARGLFGGLIARDPFADFFKIFFVLTTAIVGIMALRARDAIDYTDRDHEASEFFALALSVTLGMNLMAAATDLLMAYLSLEFVSIMSYIMAGFTRRSRRSAEASLKYVIYGGVASGVMLYGMSLLYGMAGTTDLVRIRLAAGAANPTAVFVAVAFCMAGFGYKIASVPFHMWCPDVYEGAPTPVTAFLSVGPKAAGFALLIRFFMGALPDEVATPGAVLGGAPWALMMACMSAVTMTLGNLAAIGQNNLKRLLAYSSIAHAGYLLMGFATRTAEGRSAILFYLVAYLLMNLGAFIVVLAIAEAGLGESIDDYKGLGYRSPYHAAVLSVFLFSLTGIPPMIGFVGKFYLFAALINRGGAMYVALAVVGVLNSAVSLYYYARVLKVMYLDQPVRTEPVTVARQHSLLLAPLAALTIVFGLYWSPIYAWVSGSLTMWLPSAQATAAQLLR